ncbi:hypothetical protein [Moorena sp. SIO3H5]|nr:hypothetical protein [Moorena sp. SIO3H5]
MTLIASYGGLHNYQVHRIVFPVPRSAVPCSLFSLPCSLFPKNPE